MRAENYRITLPAVTWSSFRYWTSKKPCHATNSSFRIIHCSWLQPTATSVH